MVGNECGNDKVGKVFHRTNNKAQKKYAQFMSKKMKIIYLFTSPSLNGSSVQTKVLNQIKYLNLAGADCRGAFFSTEVKEVTALNEHVDLIPIKKCEWKYFRKIGQRRLLDRAMFEYLKTKESQTDVFYLRYPGASKGLYKLSSRFGGKIVTEHQSKELEEIKTHAINNTFGIRPSKFMSWIQYSISPILNEDYYGKKIRKKIKAAVSVTREIVNYQLEKGVKKSFFISNGIVVSNYNVRKISDQLSPKPIKVIYMKGGNGDVPWSGLDRLIDSINSQTENKILIELIIAGRPEVKYDKFSFINQVGYKTKEELDDLINNVHIGLNHLGLHRIGLHESSNLKVREYFSRGLPFINASIDDDIKESEFVMQVPSNDEKIDLERISKFIKKILEDNLHPQKMRKYAEEHLDYEVKMKKLYVELLKLKNA
jgi:hypothetical protein